jgi:hypothetical protein
MSLFEILLIGLFAAVWLLGLAVFFLQLWMIDKLNNRLPRREQFSMMGRYMPLISQFDRTYSDTFPGDPMWRWRMGLFIAMMLGVFGLAGMMLLRTR